LSALNEQVGGKAYSKTYPEWPIQPVEFIHKNGIDFIRGCVIKYVCRDRFKNGHEDLLKARHYIDLLLELDGDEKEEEKPVAEPPRYRAWDNRVPTESETVEETTTTGETY